MDEFYTIIMDLFLLRFGVPPFIDVSSMDTSYSLLMDLMDSRYGAHMVVHFPFGPYFSQDVMISLLTLPHLETLFMFKFWWRSNGCFILCDTRHTS